LAIHFHLRRGYQPTIVADSRQILAADSAQLLSAILSGTTHLA